MKKTLLAMSLLIGTTGLSYAQSSVTLYGTIDTGIGFKSFKNNHTGIKASYSGLFSGVWSSNSWGLKGTEDLGDGLSANFELESGFNVLTGEGSSERLFKTTTLGLASDQWGSIKMGRVGNAVQDYAGFIAGPSDEEGLSDIKNTFSAAGSNKADNTIIYKTPVFDGAQFSVGYSFNTKSEQSWNSSDNIRLITTAMGYTNGPLSLAAGYDRLQAYEWAKKVHSWIVAGSYDFSVLTLAMAVGQDINGRQSLLGSYDDLPAFTNWNSGYTKNYKTSSFTINASVPITPVSTAIVGWSISRASSTFNDTYTLGKRDQNIFSAGYRYSLSKRTSLYALGGYATGFAFQNVRGQQAIVGLNHSF